MYNSYIFIYFHVVHAHHKHIQKLPKFIAYFYLVGKLAYTTSQEKYGYWKNALEMW